MQPDQAAASYLNYTKQGQSSECVQLMLKSDRCVQEALFVGQSPDEVLMPRTEQDVDFYCDRLKGTMACLSEYGRSCLRLMPKTLYGVMARDARKALRTMCSDAAAKGRALRHLACFRRDKLPFYYDMVNGYTNVLVHLSRPEIPVPEVIGSCCCAFHLLHETSVRVIDGECNGVTGLQTGAFVGGLVRTIASSALDVSCGKHSSIAVCQQLQPDAMALYARLLREGQTSGKRFPFSMIVPMVKILNNLDASINL